MAVSCDEAFSVLYTEDRSSLEIIPSLSAISIPMIWPYFRLVNLFIFIIKSACMDVSEAARTVDGGVEIDISVSPRSDRSGTEGVDEWRKRLIVRVKAPPLDGRANKEVEELFRKVTGCKSEVIRGQTSRQKTVLVHGELSSVMESLRQGL